MINQTVRDTVIRKAIAEIFRRASKQNLKDIFRELSNDYRDGPRFYHTLDHIAEMLVLAENYPLESSAAVKTAILYHDVVYDPERYSPKYTGGLSNEDQSSIICLNVLDHYGINKDISRRARDLIGMTKDHVAPRGDHEAALFLDLDMAILGMPRNRYEFYARSTAREFLSAFTPEEYIRGRTAFLNSVLAREEIFLTPEFAYMDPTARENMKWELQSLPSIVTRLTQPKGQRELTA